MKPLRIRAVTGSAQPPSGGRRLPVAHLLGGVLLTAVCILLALQVFARLDDRTAVLALTSDVAVGHVLTEADLRAVNVNVGSGVAVLDAGQLPSVLGRAVAVPVRAGSLLSWAQLGQRAWPPAGQAVIAVPVAAGRMPTDVAAGAHITVLISSAADTATPTAPPTGGLPGVQAQALVVAVTTAQDPSGATVVTVLLDSADALKVASTAGDVSIIMQGV